MHALRFPDPMHNASQRRSGLAHEADDAYLGRFLLQLCRRRALSARPASNPHGVGANRSIRLLHRKLCEARVTRAGGWQ